MNDKDPLIDFVSSKCRIAKKKLALDTRLFHDLDLFGDDADEFFMEFGKRFKVDVSVFPISEFFPEEKFASLLDIFKYFWSPRSLSSEEKAAFRPLTIADLIQAVKIGVLCPTTQGS